MLSAPSEDALLSPTDGRDLQVKELLLDLRTYLIAPS